MINKELCERYPYIIPRNVWTDKIAEDYDYSYTLCDCLPKGWHKLFLQMCEDIRQPLIDAGYIDKFRFSQVKEKYGTMRCYTFGTPAEVQKIIDKYEHLSFYICQKCGKPATNCCDDFYIISLCDECTESSPLRNCMEKMKPDLMLKYHMYHDGKKAMRVIDCSEEWNRLIEK